MKFRPGMLLRVCDTVRMTQQYMRPIDQIYLIISVVKLADISDDDYSIVELTLISKNQIYMSCSRQNSLKDTYWQIISNEMIQNKMS